MAKTPFLGTTYVARAADFASNQAINIYPESVENKSGAREVGIFYGTPGLRFAIRLGADPIRGMIAFGVTPTLYVVAGPNVWLVTFLSSGWSSQNLGTIGTNTGPVSMVGNRSQVGIFDGVNGYSIVANVLAEITPPTSPWNPVSAVYQDGFVLVNQHNTQVVWQSDIDDITSWDALNFSTEDGSPDNVIVLAEIHRQIVVIKENYTAFWINAGTAGFAFQRIDGVYPRAGTLAPFSESNLGEDTFWLGKSGDGGNVVYGLRGYELARISTHAIEYAISQYSTTDDAVGFSYQQEGHKFYVLTFPTGNQTWVYDVTESMAMKEPVWHQRAYFSGGLLSRWLAQTHAYYLEMHVVGGYGDGTLYTLDLSAFTDGGQPIKRLRSWRAGLAPDGTTKKCNWLQIACQTGIDTLPGTNPQYVLRQSWDGETWTPERFGSAGKTGQTMANIRFNRLGSTRRNVQQDRIFEFSTTDPIKIAWMAGEIG